MSVDLQHDHQHQQDEDDEEYFDTSSDFFTPNLFESSGEDNDGTTFRTKHGRCIECGQQTHVQRFGFGDYVVPLTLPDLVQNGTCLLMDRHHRLWGRNRGSEDMRSDASIASSDPSQDVHSFETVNPSTAGVSSSNSNYLVRTLRGHNLRIYSIKGLRHNSVDSGDAPTSKFLTGSWDKTCILWDAVKGERLQTYRGHGAGVYSVSDFGLKLPSEHNCEEDRTFLTGSIDKSVKLWNARTGECVRTYDEFPSTVRCVSSSNLNSTFLEKKEEEEEVEKDASSSSASHYLFFAGLLDHTAGLWDAELGECIQTYTGHANWVSSVTNLDARGTKFVTSSADKTAKLWDTFTGECLRTFEGHSLRVDYVANLDATSFFTGSADKTIKLWDVETGRCLQTFEGHTYHVTCVASMGNGMFVTSSKDKTAKLWDLNTGVCVHTYAGHKDWVTSVANLDGNMFVTGSNDCTAKLWTVP